MTLPLPTRISDWLLQLVTSQQSVAYLLLDHEHVVARTGGALQHHGLSGLRPGSPASEQWAFLEGLLPLADTPFLLPLVGMPSGRVADVHVFVDEDGTWVVLLDVSAPHDEARQVQQKAYDMTLLSQREARLMARLQGAHADLTAAHRELEESREALLRTHRRLERELRDAERYVRAILPVPLTAPFDVDWRFVPSTELGGDSFGYHWIDAEHFALYLLDVCGHGVGAALLSVAVTTTLRAGTLRQTDFRRPEEVLASLNRSYQMDDHDGMYFTIWYGVYHHPSGRLRYASAGHPPAILVRGPHGSRGEVHQLSSPGLLLGMLPDTQYQSEECRLVGPARLFLFSDGAFEVRRPDDSMLEFSEFEDRLAGAGGSVSELDEVLRFAQHTRGAALLEDDFSIIRMMI